MKLHSDTLTIHELRDAAKVAGVYIWEISSAGSRKRHHAWNLYLSGSSSYRSQATGEKAATWDEHGVFMAELYKRDPYMLIAHYKSLADFITQTEERVHSIYNGMQPESKKVRGPWLEDDRLRSLA